MRNEKNDIIDENVFSSDGKTFFKIIEHSEKYFSLEKYIVCYDEEEEVEYTVRQKPDPAGRYETVEIAIDEGKQILG